MALSTILLVVVSTAATTPAGGVGRNFVPGPPEARAAEYTGPPYEAPFLRHKEPSLGMILRSIETILGTMFPHPDPPKPPRPPQGPVAASQAPPPPPPPVTSSGGRPKYETPISNWNCNNPNGHTPRPDVAAAIQQTFGPAAAWAESIAVRESGCDPGAYNPSGAKGLFQMVNKDGYFQQVGCDPNNWADIWCNVRAAYQLYVRGGIGHWSASFS